MESTVSQSDVWLRTLRWYGRYQPPTNSFGMTPDTDLQLLETFARDPFTGRGRIVDAFDAFVWHESMEQSLATASLPRRYASGAIFTLHRGDLRC